MSTIVWDLEAERFFETGIDKAVLYPNGKTAVPWNGLTAVDENGSDGIQSYYLDGRPYLHVPSPKEYSATIRAYTYPDEFSAAIGLVEIAEVDGMYVDSQISDKFDLCYRTHVGNAIDGVDHAYKIHLVYNAVVVPPQFSYEALSSEINPSEFTWEIAAVPVPVEGYRPTAHIVIDTRHMDAAKIAQIEAMLYGTPVADPIMPDPVTIMEMLTYGDTITIINHGDGTWSAQGSYERIYMVGDTVFQIDDVNAVQNGDGTFDISTTS